jgi:toxin ParE1/3/4
MSKLTYMLSQAAEEDLGQIFDYAELEFGLDQSIQYLSEMERLFYQLCDNPMLGRERKEICEGLRSIPSGSHVIFYRVLTHQVRVVRVLHASRDLPKFLKGSE